MQNSHRHSLTLLSPGYPANSNPYLLAQDDPASGPVVETKITTAQVLVTMLLATLGVSIGFGLGYHTGIYARIGRKSEC